jgi:hypothetical protein
MSALTPEMVLTLGVASAIAMTLLTVLYQRKATAATAPTATAPTATAPTATAPTAPTVPVDAPSPPTANPVDADSAYITALVTRSLELKTKEERLNNAQELYEYLVLHPTLLLQQPGVRDVVQRKATETLRVLQQDTTLPYPFVVRVQRTMDAFVFTLQAITLLPGYIP